MWDYFINKKIPVPKGQGASNEQLTETVLWLNREVEHLWILVSILLINYFCILIPDMVVFFRHH